MKVLHLGPFKNGVKVVISFHTPSLKKDNFYLRNEISINVENHLNYYDGQAAIDLSFIILGLGFIFCIFKDRNGTGEV